jgi:hypothetical protein
MEAAPFRRERSGPLPELGSLLEVAVARAAANAVGSGAETFVPDDETVAFQLLESDRKAQDLGRIAGPARGAAIFVGPADRPLLGEQPAESPSAGHGHSVLSRTKPEYLQKQVPIHIISPVQKAGRPPYAGAVRQLETTSQLKSPIRETQTGSVCNSVAVAVWSTTLRISAR